MNSFRLSRKFVNKYKDIKPDFGFNGLGEIVYYRTYSRIKDDNQNENWYETIERVVNGTYNLQKEHIESNGLRWDAHKAQKSAQEMFDRMFNMKFLPPGRGLWAMGSAITEKKKLFAALNNCGFSSTEKIKDDPTGPFCFLMDASMLGVGVGFDTKGAGKIDIKGPNKKRAITTHQIEDTREGWVESLHLLLESYFLGLGQVEFDYSVIRAAGEPIKGFGGKSSGSEPLKKMHEKIRELLDQSIGDPLSVTNIVDIMNLVGVCVVAGNVRRTAEIVFGDPNSEEYIDLKNKKVNPDRNDNFTGWGWTSNNSIFAELGMNYENVANRTAENGEPGYAWLENMKAYGRMMDPPNHKDHRALGGNPCLRGNTKIAVADGRNAVSIKQLAEEGKDVSVYSVNPETGKVSIKWGRNPRVTQKNAELVRIHFEDGGFTDCTLNHKWILKDGSWKYAKDLKEKDSLMRFTKRQESIKKGGKPYWRVNTNTFTAKEGKLFEHRLVADFFNPETKQKMYDEHKQSGWIKGGLVVHHKDYNPLNNSPENLEWMSFEDHTAYHAQRDNKGKNNSMYGRKHSEHTKKLISEKTIERCKDPEYIKKISEAQTDENRKKASERLSDLRISLNKEYYIEQEKNTDLDTFWVGEKLYARKTCEHCGISFSVEWGRRDRCYCSTDCWLEVIRDMEKRKSNQRIALKNKQEKTLHEQIMLYKDLNNELGRKPWKKEWESLCKDKGVSRRFNSSGWQSKNPYVLSGYTELKQVSETYNHRVSKVEFLEEKEDVYCLTVDDNHTIAVIPEGTDINKSFSGIFTYQCLEQTLEDRELCCLVENFIHKHDSIEDFIKTLKYSYLYAKTVTLGKTHWPETNRVMLRNRRIGSSLSGIQMFVGKNGIDTLKTWLEQGYKAIEKYDELYSDWLAIPKSIKKTSIKPSGTVSKLVGATAGMHWPNANYCIKNMRIGKNSEMIPLLKKSGYKIEPSVNDPDNTLVVSIPYCIDESVRKVEDVSLWEQVSMAAFLQKYWADNQVSCTVEFNENEKGQIKHALNYFQYQLKGISFLPRLDLGAYPQMPEQPITKEEYEKMNKKLKLLDLSNVSNEEVDKEVFCDTEKCEIAAVIQDHENSNENKI